MTWLRARPIPALAGSVVLSAALAAGSLVGAPSANATCASVFGLGNSADCTSGLFSVAIAIGPNAKATALAPLSLSLALGGSATSTAEAGMPINGGNLTLAIGGVAATKGLGNLAVGIGGSAFANGGINAALTLLPNGGLTSANGYASLAVLAFSTAGGNVYTSGNLNASVVTLSNGGVASSKGNGNLAVSALGSFASAYIEGNGNLAGVLLSNSGQALANGNFNNAFTVAVDGAWAQAGSTSQPSTLATAFNVFSRNSQALTRGGPFAYAGSILQDGPTITQTGTGFNINGFKVGGAAAVNRTKAGSANATKATAAKGAAKPSGSVGGSKRKAASGD
ncbi:hypothetical protein [Mycobacterium sp. M26]|uniref:hypothetical protein n=1 Tax=Mycobacterium sp. M26 TaxID=1762962 RepID=UPI00073EF0D0|nr:hypothetical protein [Mycobacterium sp. M26]